MIMDRNIEPRIIHFTKFCFRILTMPRIMAVKMSISAM